MDTKRARIFITLLEMALAMAVALLPSEAVFASPEALLPKSFRETILPYFLRGKAGTFRGKEGVPIAYRIFPATNGALSGSKSILILPGRSEFMEKYAELIYDLRNAGYSFYIMDHRGQGESGRMLPDTQLGHVVNFEDYVADLDTFVREVIQPQRPSELHVIAHSLGAVIASLDALKHPGEFTSLALSSPMIRPRLGSYPESIALALATFLGWVGHGNDVAPGRAADEWKDPFEKSHVTSSQERYDYARTLLLEDPRMAIGGPTVRWVEQAIYGSRWLRASVSGLKTPTLMLSAGHDEVVFPQAEEIACRRALNCQLIPLMGAQHEILMERDAIRDHAIELMLQFIRKNGVAQPQS